MAETKSAMQCGHCGYKAVFELCAEYSDSHEEYEEDEYSGEKSPYPDAWWSYTWQLFKCPHCSRPTLKQIGDSSYQDEVEYKILYPANQRLTNLPKHIAKEYQAALKVQHIEPSACAVLVGRTLEAVCNHEKVTGKTLSDKLNNLVSSDRIPKTLAEMAHQLRQIRNIGAHDAEDKVTEEDVPIIVDFLEAILEYLYVAPAKIAALKERFQKAP